MFEFLIRRTDARWFDFPYPEYPGILRPHSIASQHIEGWGSNRIEVEGEEISFSDEFPGFQVCFEHGVVSEARAEIVEDIRQNIEQKTGQKADVIQMA